MSQACITRLIINTEKSNPNGIIISSDPTFINHKHIQEKEHNIQLRLIVMRRDTMQCN